MKNKYIKNTILALVITNFIFSFSNFSFANDLSSPENENAINYVNNSSTDSEVNLSNLKSSDPAYSLFSSSNEVDLGINAPSCSLIDVDSGKFLYGKDMFEKMYPASTTKLMTAIIVLENCEDLSQKVNVSYYAVHSVPYSYSIANLFPKEQFTVRELLETLLIASANDSAYVLAEFIANNGNNYSLDSDSDAKINFNASIAKFANMMNEKASLLGCTDTNFVNPNGIANENHYSTAHDLALIGKYAYSNSTIRDIVTKQTGTLENTDVYTGEQRNYSTTNLLLKKGYSGYYQYANGLKTGYTDKAEFCIIASAKKDNRNLVAVVLHSESTRNSETSRESDCKKLFEYGFNNFITTKLASSNQIMKSLTILNAKSDNKNLDLFCKDDINVLIKKGDVLDVTPEVKVDKLLAPISQNEVVGTVTYNVYGEKYSSDLIASNNIESASYNFFIIILVVTLIILFILYLIILKPSNPKKKHKHKHKHGQETKYINYLKYY